MRNEALETAYVDVLPNMSRFASELREQLKRLDFYSMGREIGGEISQGIASSVQFPDGGSTVSAIKSWTGLAGSIATIGVALAPIAGVIGKALLAAGKFIVKVAVIVAAIVAVAGLLAGLFVGLLGAKQGLIDAFFGVIRVVLGVVDLIVGIFTGDGQRISEAWDTIWQGVTETIAGIWDAIKGFIQGFVDGISGFFQWLYDALIGNSIVPKMINGIRDWFNRLIEFVMAPVRTMIAAVTNTFNGLRDFAVNTFNNIREGISNAISNAVTAVTGAVSRMFSAAGSFMRGLLNGIREGATNALTRIRELATDLITTVTGFAGRMRSAAGDLINGLIQGIANGAARVAERMRQLARDALAAAKRIFGINSPSREFAKIGEGICEGLLNGIESGMSEVIKTVCDLADTITGAFEASATASLDSLYSGVGALGPSKMGGNFQLANSGVGVGDTYLTFNTPVTGYHEVLAANRAAQRMVARS